MAEIRVDPALPMTSDAIAEELGRLAPQIQAAEESLGSAIVKSALAEKQGDSEGMKAAEKQAREAQERLWPLRSRARALEERGRALEREHLSTARAMKKADLLNNLLPMVPAVNERATLAREGVIEAGRMLLAATQEFLSAQSDLDNLKSAVQQRAQEFGLAAPPFASLSWGGLYLGKLRLSDFFLNLGSRVPERRTHRISPLSQVSRMATLAGQKNGH